MNIITVDFETAYSQEYSLSKMTTEEYIHDPQFEVIGVSVKVDDEPTEWASGTHAQIKQYLHSFPWADSALLAHNTAFDGAILSWVFDVHPKVLLDTLSMARAVHGIEVSGSLANLVKMYGLGEKGTEVIDAKGKWLMHFTPAELSRYGDYCINDTELTRRLFMRLVAGFPKRELKLIDLTLRMFTEPVLELDYPALKAHLANVQARKQELLLKSGATDAELQSADMFAELLRKLGVEPPVKVSPRTGKVAYAFAKTDEGLKELLEHDDDRVQALVSARLGAKSTLEETRTTRFMGIAERSDKLPIPLRYYAAHTGRWAGTESINLQNLPSRGVNAKAIKKAILPPAGYTLVDADSSQIEARVLAWLAGQDDLVEAFRRGDDVYKSMASVLYNTPEADIDTAQRFMGKSVILGCGYGLGADKFKDTLRAQGVVLPIEETKRIIATYRSANDKIVRLWRTANNMLQAMVRGEPFTLSTHGILPVIPESCSVQLPSGLLLRYADLRAEETDKGLQFSYSSRSGRTRIYGGKVVENLVQALARCVVAEQMLLVAKRHHVVLTVHDSVVCCVPDADVPDAVEYITRCMRTVPAWAPGLPINCEVGFGKTYGDC